MNSSSDLLYLQQKLDSNRLCISNTCQKRILQYVHDEHVHEEIHWIHDLLRRSVFMFRMTIKIKKYVTACLTCQLFKFFRQRFYKKLQFIKFLAESLTKFSLNFIVILLMTLTENNTIMFVTNKFSKHIKMILEKKILFAKKWKVLYWRHVFKNWNISIKLINDRDSKIQFRFLNSCFQSARNLTRYDHDLSFINEWASRKIQSNNWNNIEMSSCRKTRRTLKRSFFSRRVCSQYHL